MISELIGQVDIDANLPGSSSKFHIFEGKNQKHGGQKSHKREKFNPSKQN